MEISIYQQALGLAGFFLLGLCLGLIYDLLRPLRYALRHSFFCDAIFCALGAVGCFFLTMYSGRPALWHICSSLLAFCLYINFASPLLLPPLLKFFGLLNAYVRKLEKIYLNAKKFFSNEEL